MPKKKIDDAFVCPKCGLPTIQEVERSFDDFLAIHSRVYGMVDRNIPCEVVVHSCSSTGTFRREDIVPCEKARFDLPKSHFPRENKNG